MKEKGGGAIVGCGCANFFTRVPSTVKRGAPTVMRSWLWKYIGTLPIFKFLILRKIWGSKNSAESRLAAFCKAATVKKWDLGKTIIVAP